MPKRYPDTIIQALEESGVEFDENGNIVEETLKTQFDVEDDQEDDNASDENDSDEDGVEDSDEDDVEDSDEDDVEDSDEDSDEDDVEDSDEDDVEDSDEDEDEDEGKDSLKSKRTVKKPESIIKKLKLTKPEESNETPSDSKTKQRLDEISSELERLTSKNKSPDAEKPTEDEISEIKKLVKTLTDERASFRRERNLQTLEKVKSGLESRNYGVTLEEIISSKEWRDYLSMRVLGQPVKTLYADAVHANDSPAILEFFDDFAKRYAQSSKDVSKPVKRATKRTVDKKSSKSNELEELAVPNRSKAVDKNVSLKKWLFTTQDYENKLDAVARGHITRAEFAEFDRKYENAERQGKVKQS